MDALHSFKHDREMYDKAVLVVRALGHVSPMVLQRALYIGYNRAAHLIDAMQAKGVVSEPSSTGKRTVLEVA